MPTPRDTESLIGALDAGTTFAFLPFYGHTPEAEGPGPWVLSQWYPSPFVVRGERYATAEHWMMAEKARIFDDPETRAAILAAPTPEEAKRLGRQVRRFVDEWWCRAREWVVISGNTHKFEQHPALRAYLLGTRDAILVEAAPRDTIWGIGMGARNPAVEDPRRWKGHNLLGFALIAVRDALREADARAPKTPRDQLLVRALQFAALPGNTLAQAAARYEVTPGALRSAKRRFGPIRLTLDDLVLAGLSEDRPSLPRDLQGFLDWQDHARYPEAQIRGVLDALVARGLVEEREGGFLRRPGWP